MAFMELYPIVVAALLWGPEWKCRKVLFRCDNQATVAIVRKGRSKCLHIMQLMRKLTWCACEYNFMYSSSYVPGASNVLSDALSRLQIEKFFKLAPNAEKQPHKCPPVCSVMWC